MILYTCEANASNSNKGNDEMTKTFTIIEWNAKTSTERTYAKGMTEQQAWRRLELLRRQAASQQSGLDYWVR